jgi:uncharacterized protein
MTDFNFSKIEDGEKKPTSENMDGLQNVAAGLGTSRDKRTQTTYVPTVYDPYLLSAMYQTSPLSAKIVDAPADDMTRKWREFVISEDNEDEGQLTSQLIAKEERRLGLASKINEGLKWGRLFGGSIVVIGMKDGKHDQPLQVDKVKKGDLRYLLVVDRFQIGVSGNLVSDPESRHFGLPEYYTISGLGLATSVRVHYTRVLRFEGKKLPFTLRQTNNYWGLSILEQVSETIKNKDSVSAAIGTMLFEANVDIIQVEGLANMLSQPGGDAKVTRRWESGLLIKGLHRVLLLDKGETYDRKAYTFTGLSDMFNAFRSDVSAASDIPETRLFGRSPAGMNATGDSDLRNYYDSLDAQRATNVYPELDYFDQIFLRSTLGHLPPEYSYSFPPLWQMDDNTKATVQKTAADRDKVYLDAGVVSEVTIAKKLKADKTYPITRGDIELLEQLSKMEPEPPEPPENNTITEPVPHGTDPMAKGGDK